MTLSSTLIVSASTTLNRGVCLSDRDIQIIASAIEYIQSRYVWDTMSDSAWDSLDGDLGEAITHVLDNGNCGSGGGTVASIGDIQIIAHSTIPVGFLACDGSAISRTTYADLFSLVGTTYGVGDGSTTFNIPDLRGRTAIGIGTGTGLTGRSLGDSVGAETHQLTVAELPAHTHRQQGTVNQSGSQNYVVRSATAQGHAGADDTQSTGGDSSHNNMQPSLALHYIIKVE